MTPREQAELDLVSVDRQRAEGRLTPKPVPGDSDSPLVVVFVNGHLVGSIQAQHVERERAEGQGGSPADPQQPGARLSVAPDPPLAPDPRRWTITNVTTADMRVRNVVGPECELEFVAPASEVTALQEQVKRLQPGDMQSTLRKYERRWESAKEQLVEALARAASAEAKVAELEEPSE